MKALVLKPNKQAEVIDQPVPEPDKGEVRVRVHYVGICGSDLHYYFSGKNGSFEIREPLIPGHEIAGEVDLDPTGTYDPGTPVTIFPARFGTPDARLASKQHLWPGGDYLGSAATFPHRQGGASEYLIVSSSALRVLPSGLATKVATLSEPLAVALHATRIPGSVAGADVLINGAGSIGILVLASLYEAGAASVTVSDIQDEALVRAKKFEPDHIVNITDLESRTDMFDVIFECSGANVAVTSVIAWIRPGGRIVQIGMLPDIERSYNLAGIVSKEVTYFGSQRFVDEMSDSICLLQRYPKLGQLITHTFELDNVKRAFDVAKDSSISGKVVLDLR